MSLSRIFIGIFFLACSNCMLGQEILTSDSAINNHVQSQLVSLKTQLNDIKLQLNLIVKLLQDRTLNQSNIDLRGYPDSKWLYPEETNNYIDSFVERDLNDSILCPSETRLKRLGMTPSEYYTQNTPHDEEMVCYIDNEGNVIAGSGMLNGISLKPKMYKEVHSESKMSQNKIIYASSASPADIAREIRRQEANAKALEAGTELLFNLIFSPKK